MQRDRAELAVGATVLAALGILLYSTFRVGGCAWLEPTGTRLVARFDDAGGVDPRTHVLVAGVKVGEVEAVELDGGRARLTLRVDDPALGVPADSTVRIRSRGMLGERVIEIVRGQDPTLLSDGDTLTRSVEAPNLDAMLDALATVAEDVEAVTGSVRAVLGDAQGEEAVAQIVEDVRFVAAGLRGLVESNGDELTRVLGNFDEASQNLASISQDFAELASDKQQTVGEMLDNFARSSERLGDAVEDLAAVSERVEKGEGTIGKLVADEELYTKLDESVTELKRTLSEVRRAAEDAQEQLPVTVLGSLVGSLF